VGNEARHSVRYRIQILPFGVVRREAARLHNHTLRFARHEYSALGDRARYFHKPGRVLGSERENEKPRPLGLAIQAKTWRLLAEDHARSPSRERGPLILFFERSGLPSLRNFHHQISSKLYGCCASILSTRRSRRRARRPALQQRTRFRARNLDAISGGRRQGCS